MRRKSLWKNLMLATALTVVLGTAPVTAFAADVDSTVTEAEQTVPEADTTVKDEVSAPEAKAITVDVATSSTTFDGTQDIVITYTINGYIEGTPVYGDMPRFNGSPHNIIREKVSDSVYRFTIEKVALQAVIAENNATDGQTFVFDSGYSYAEDFPTVTLTYTTGDNGDNGNGETPEKPENPDPDNGNGGNGNGETPEKPENPDPENPDNGNGDNNGQTPENPDNGNGDNNGGQTPETPDNGNGQTPETPDNGNSNTNNQNNTQNNTNNNQTTAKPTKTSPKTGDATATLPVAGTGLASLGVALATVLRKRK